MSAKKISDIIPPVINNYNFLTGVRMNLNLKIARTKQGKTRYDLSFLTRIPQGIISLIENGIKQPTPAQAQKISEALKVDVKEIFPEIAEMQKESK